jgi:hypothetical protein
MDSSVHPPRVYKLEYLFDGWLGDHLLEAFPCFVVTDQLSEAIARMGLTGCAFERMDSATSLLFLELHPDRLLPPFVWMKVLGKAFKDDLGLSTDFRLVASERALATFRSFALAHCEVHAVGIVSG